MNTKIHPKIYNDAKVICTCGNVLNTSSTVPEVHIEVCSKCHPFFTGDMKFVDTLGRVEKFQKKQKKAKEIKAKRIEKVAENKHKTRPDSLKDMFDLVKKQASS